MLPLEKPISFKRIRNYGIGLVVALAMIHTGALAAFYTLEKDEAQQELKAVSSRIPADATSTSTGAILPQGFVAIKAPEHAEHGFFEMSLGNEEYLVYANPQNQFAVARTTEKLNNEVEKLAMILLALFIGELVLLIGWWFFVRDIINSWFEA